MSKGLLLRASQFDSDNLAIARQVLADPEQHPVFTVTWARLVLARLGDDRGKSAQAVLAFDEVTR